MTPIPNKADQAMTDDLTEGVDHQGSTSCYASPRAPWPWLKPEGRGYVSKDAVARAKRVMSAVDAYHALPDGDNRHTLRSVIMDEFEELLATAAQPSQAQAAEAVDEYPPTQASESAARVGVLTFHLRRVVLTYEAGEKAKVPLSEVIEGIRDFLQDSGWKRNAVSLSSTTPPASPVASNEREGLTVSAAEKKRIAGIVHTDCTLIPGATFYHAAELAIDATLALLSARNGGANE